MRLQLLQLRLYYKPVIVVKSCSCREWNGVSFLEDLAMDQNVRILVPLVNPKLFSTSCNQLVDWQVMVHPPDIGDSSPLICLVLGCFGVKWSTRFWRRWGSSHSHGISLYDDCIGKMEKTREFPCINPLACLWMVLHQCQRFSEWFHELEATPLLHCSMELHPPLRRGCSWKPPETHEWEEARCALLERKIVHVSVSASCHQLASILQGDAVVGSIMLLFLQHRTQWKTMDFAR